MVSLPDFERSLDSLMAEEGERFVGTVPYASHLTDPTEPLNEAYYLRHRVETIKRIRLTSEVDAAALEALVKEDYDAARPWSRYVAEELDHDILFLRDLAQHHYTADRVNAIKLFPSTVRLIEFLRESTRDLGALPAVAYSLFVEWNSRQYSPAVVAKAEVAYSPNHVSGSKIHCRIDENEDHYEMLVGIAYRLVTKRGDPKLLFRLIATIAEFLRAYFHELYAETVMLGHDTAPGR